MPGAFYLLLVIGVIGVGDILYFHNRRCGLSERAECQREVLWHTIRHLIYALQFFAVANLRFHGSAVAIWAILYGIDVFVAWSDVWEEPSSRKQMGGLPRGEYMMHIVLSLLVGIYMATVAHAVWPDRLLPTAVVYAPPPVPSMLRVLMNGMGLVAIGAFAYDLRRWWGFRAQRSGRRAGAA